MQQFVNMIKEQASLNVTYDRKTYPIIKFSNTEQDGEGKRLIHSLEYDGFILTRKQGNTCFQSTDGDIIAIENIFLQNENIHLYGKKYLHSKLFEKPCDSSVVGIYIINEDVYKSVTVSSRKIKCKCLKLIVSERESAIFPFVHAQYCNKCNKYLITTQPRR